jgi:large subunit ribosomal protein L30
MAKIKITQIKSIIDRSERQKRTMKALGLTKMNQSVEVEANAAIIGMVRAVNHLIAIEAI